MELMGENYKSVRIRRHYVFFINFSLKSNILNILKEKNLYSSLFFMS